MYFLSLDCQIESSFSNLGGFESMVMTIFDSVWIAFPSQILSQKTLYMKVDLIFLDHYGYVTFTVRTTPVTYAKECTFNLEPTNYIILEKIWDVELSSCSFTIYKMIVHLKKFLHPYQNNSIVIYNLL